MTMDNQREELINKRLDIQIAYRELGDLVPEETAHQLMGYINRDLDQLVPKILAALNAVGA